MLTVERITEDQAANIESLITEVTANKEKFLAYFKIGAVEELAARDYKSAVKQLEKKRAG